MQAIKRILSRKSSPRPFFAFVRATKFRSWVQIFLEILKNKGLTKISSPKTGFFFQIAYNKTVVDGRGTPTADPLGFAPPGGPGIFSPSRAHGERIHNEIPVQKTDA
jgi:hypothetical protein